MSGKCMKSKKQKPEKKTITSLDNINPFAAGIDVGANSIFVCAPFNGELEVN